jgi:hypothetical protein
MANCISGSGWTRCRWRWRRCARPVEADGIGRVVDARDDAG